MDEFEHDEISKEFADLMAALEDAAAVAIKGQSADRPLALLQTDVNDLWQMMVCCVGILGSLERRLDQQENRLVR